MKKRVFSLLLALTLLLCALPLPVHAAANEITVYNWGQYISDGTDESLDVIQAFEEETGIKVNYLTFDSNESMYTKLKTGGTTFDVIIPSDYMIAKLISEDMLEPLDFANIPNYEYIDEAFRDQAYDPQNAYSVPYTWGTVGLIYNKNYVSEEDAQSWSCLWNSKYQGKLLMFDNPRDAFAIAESMLGYSFNTEDEQEFKNCADLLATQSPVLQGYVMDQIFDRMERGEAWAAPYYAGDYLTMVEENPDLGFSHPKEGFNIFIDAMCIPKGCQNKAGAEAFINFLCRPDISAANLDYIGYSTPETAAKEYLDEEVISSPVSYPDDETLARSESFAELGVEATQTMNDLWLSVKTSTANTTTYLILTLVAIAAVAAFFIISGIVKRRKKRAAAANGSRHKPTAPVRIPAGSPIKTPPARSCLAGGIFVICRELSLQDRPGSGDDGGLADTVELQQGLRVAGTAEAVLHADTLDRTGQSAHTTSATAPPRPPRMLCSSAVTIAPVSFAAFRIASRSIGLIVCISITRAWIPSFSSSSAAASASATTMPVAMIVRSGPSRSVTDLPIVN